MSVSATALKRRAKFHPEADHSATLPGRYYHDPKIFARERDEIFFKTWQLAGYLADLREPGDYITTQLFDQNILTVRGKDRRLRAFYNVCQHRGHELLVGQGRQSIITCPYHAWSYDLEGKLKAAGNAENVAGFEIDDFCLTEVQVEEFAHMAFINLDADAPSLASQAGEMVEQFHAAIPEFDQLKFARRDPFEIRCNWKFIFDAMECYHCPHIHSSKMGAKDSYLEPSFEITNYGIWARHIVRGNRDITSDNKRNLAFITGANDAQQDVHIWWLWPNLFFVSHLGPANLKIMHGVPVEPEFSFEHVDNFCINDPPSEVEIAGMNRFRDITQPEDIYPMESQQRGVHSVGYSEGRLMVDQDRSWRSEHGVHHFNKLVWQALNGDRYEGA